MFRTEDMPPHIAEKQDHGATLTNANAPAVVSVALKDAQAYPNIFARSALFGMVSKRHKVEFSNEAIPCWSGWRMQYTGAQLSQTDLDVYLVATNLLGMANANEITISYSKLLGKLGRKHSGKSNISWLRSSLQRLANNHLLIGKLKHVYQGPLLSMSESKKGVTISISPAQAFVWRETTWLNPIIRGNIRPDIASWLYAYIMTHEANAWNPPKLKLETFANLCGTRNKAKRCIKHMILLAFETLKQNKLIMDYQLVGDNDVIEFTRFYVPKKKTDD